LALVEIEHLYHRFADGSDGLVDVSLRIEKGEFIVLTGPNGAGKTLLLLHLNGLLNSSGGTVSVGGKSVKRHLLQARKTIGLVFQDADSQLVGETVESDVGFGPRNLLLPGEEVERRTGAALTRLGLSNLAQRAPHTLSGGEKRRLTIAGVLAMQPAFVAFDEPFTSLDYRGVLETLGTITRLHEEGHTIMVVTHDLDKILAHAGRLIVMARGRIVLDGPQGDILPGVEAYGVRRPPVPTGKMSWLK
jgi:biotin transport system ATP-binding protein